MTPEAQKRYQQSEKGRETRRSRDRLADATPEGREAKRAKDRAFARSNPDWIRNKNLRLRYGITLDTWRCLFASQDHACALCKTTTPGRRGWATDHDHVTGRVRGILCHRCNLLLGWLGDTASATRERTGVILSYLEKA